MTHRERFIRTLKCEKIGGQVPHVELIFFPTMEAFGKVHPRHRMYDQWGQMSLKEKQLHMNDIADVYIQTAQRYDYSAILVQGIPENSLENTQWLLETIREKSGDEYYLMLANDPTWAIPNGDNMMDFAVQMLEEPEKLNAVSQRKMEDQLQFAHKLDVRGHLCDGFALCSDYCFNVNPFFTPDQFEELIVPYLKGIIDGYREMGYYSIKHTDGNIMPILKQMADCKPDAIHSLDPQGGVNLREVRKVVGPDIALIGNVNCGLLQTGSEEECDADVMRALREGMADGRGYIFATSNCVYPGLDLARYERMWNLWKKYGVYPQE